MPPRVQVIGRMQNFSEELVAAVSAHGSMLAVAERLGVQPQTIYRWIAGFELPEKAEQERLLALLHVPRA